MQPSGDRVHRVRGLLAGACSAALAIAALAGCSGSGGSGDGARNGDASGDRQTAPAAPPGRYRVLPEPCGSISPETLRKLVPDAEDSAGEATVTFDTDRKAGCKWTGRTELGNRFLHIDLERVVSYDTSVSDESQAKADYDTRAVEAHIPTATTPTEAAGSPSGIPSGSPSGTPDTPRSEGPSPTASGASSPSATATGDISPRTLDDLGDGAFLNDVLKDQDSGIHRDITVVFRMANVLVTVELSQWSTDKSVEPPSEELQLGARRVAAELADQLDE
ncbi:hypothetical protein [Streptomyces sp. NPDC026673]|uniref:hypothetical protein n=1 Tax=Streptomyces sp. NPDC026673 TaxID=3155724 RepID=UPI0034083732